MLTAAIAILGAFAPQATPQTDATPIRGRVLDAGGQPIAEVAIRLTGGDWHDAEVAAAPQTRTGSDGRFAVTLTMPRDRTERLVVVAPGHCPVEFVFPHSEVGQMFYTPLQTHLGDIVLRPAVAIRGKVRTAQGKPIEGAEVTLAALDHEESLASGLRRGNRMSIGRTDAKGNFVVLGPRDDASSITVRAAGFLRIRRNYVTADEPMLFELQPSREIRGDFLDADGKPVPGIVSLMRGPEEHGRGTVAADGSFRITVEALGATTIEATEQRAAARQVTAPLGDPAAKVELRLPAIDPVPVIVVDAASRQPIAGASVQVGWLGGDWAEFAPLRGVAIRPIHTTDASGRALVAGPSNPQFGIGAALVRAPGFALGIARNLSCKADAPSTIELHRGITLAGKVQDDDGRPVAGARVWAIPEVETAFLVLGGGEQHQYARTETGQDGSFTLPPLTEGQWRVTASAPGHVDKTNSRKLRSGKTAELTLTLPKTQTLAGKLVGAPIGAGWLIRAVTREPEAPSFLLTPTPADLSAAVAIAADGTFVLTGVHGQQRLTLSIPDVNYCAGGFEVDVGRVTIGDVEQQTIRLDERLPGRIRGRVRMIGAQLEHPRLVVETYHRETVLGAVALQTVSRDGTFSLPARPGQHVLVLVDIEHGLPLAQRTVNVTAGAAVDADFTLPLTKLHLSLSGPAEALRCAFLDLKTDLNADAEEGRQVSAPGMSRARRLALEDGRTEFDLLVPLRECTACVVSGRWSQEEPLAEASLTPKADTQNQLRLELKR